MNFSVDSLDEVGREGGAAQSTRESSPVTSSRRSLPTSLSSTATAPPPSSHRDGSRLSPWEKWMVQKAREELARRTAHGKKMSEEKVRQDRERREAVERRRRANRAHKEWVVAAVAQERERKEQTRRSAAEQVAQERERWEAVALRSREKYSEWCRTKEEEEAARKRREEAVQREKAKAKAERMQKSQKSYNLWLESMYARTRDAPSVNQYGLDQPSYCNPTPWVGPLDTEDGCELAKPLNRHRSLRTFS